MKRVVSICLAVTLLMSTVLTANAVQTNNQSSEYTYDDYSTFYFLAPRTEKVNYFALNDEVGYWYWMGMPEDSIWPGPAAEKAPEIGKDVYKVDLPDIATGLIFNAYVDAYENDSYDTLDPYKAPFAFQTADITDIEVYPGNDHRNEIYVLDLDTTTDGDIPKTSGKWFSTDPEDKNYYRLSDWYEAYNIENDTAPDYPISDKQYHAGDTVTVTYSISDIDSFGSAGSCITFNEDVLEVNSEAYTDSKGNGTWFEKNADIYPTIVLNNTSNGIEIGIVTEDAEFGTDFLTETDIVKVQFIAKKDFNKEDLGIELITSKFVQITQNGTNDITGYANDYISINVDLTETTDNTEKQYHAGDTVTVTYRIYDIDNFGCVSSVIAYNEDFLEVDTDAFTDNYGKNQWYEKKDHSSQIEANNVDAKILIGILTNDKDDGSDYSEETDILSIQFKAKKDFNEEDLGIELTTSKLIQITQNGTNDITDYANDYISINVDLTETTDNTEKQYHAGDTVTVTYSIYDMDNFGAASSVIAYNKDFLEVDSNAYTDKRGNGTWFEKNTNIHPTIMLNNTSNGIEIGINTEDPEFGTDFSNETDIVKVQFIAKKDFNKEDLGIELITSKLIQIIENGTNDITDYANDCISIKVELPETTDNTEKQYHAGDIVTFTYSIANIENFGSANSVIEYNKDILELNKKSSGGEGWFKTNKTLDLMIAVNDTSQGVAMAILTNNAKSGSDFTNETDILTVQFRAKEDFNEEDLGIDLIIKKIFKVTSTGSVDITDFADDCIFMKFNIADSGSAPDLTDDSDTNDTDTTDIDNTDIDDTDTTDIDNTDIDDTDTTDIDNTDIDDTDTTDIDDTDTTKKDTDSDKKGSDKDTDSDTSKPDKPVKKIIVGDVDGDNRISSADALIVLRYSVKLETFTDEQFEAADVNKDNAVNSADSLFVLRRSVKLKDEGTFFDD